MRLFGWGWGDRVTVSADQDTAPEYAGQQGEVIDSYYSEAVECTIITVVIDGKQVILTDRDIQQ